MADDAIYFETPEELHAWLGEHHATASELWVGYHKKASGRRSLTWQDVVDEVLCFGWIDGEVQTIDEQQAAQSDERGSGSRHSRPRTAAWRPSGS